MKTTRIPQIMVIQSDDPMDFQTKFNDLTKSMSDVDDMDVQIFSDGDYKAIITYYLSTKEINSVADEFHSEGIHFLCRNCPYLEDPKDKRIKYCNCKYAELGRTHKDHEACELFYREVKTGLVTPLEDYMR